MAKETSLNKVKEILNPTDNYPGEWEIGKDLMSISLSKNDKNLFQEFLNRYYYTSLNVLFNDDESVRNFDYGLCSLSLNNKRKIYFSKRIFLRNFISNIDDVINSNGVCAYKDIKKALRIKKDMYRDVQKNLNKSDYYEDILNEYNRYNLDITLEEYIQLSKKKYTRLLRGYNALIDFFDKPIDTDKLINCFDSDQLYLYLCYSILKTNKLYIDLYSRLDYTIKYVDEYIKYIKEERKRCSFYNNHIIINGKISKVYTVDDLIKEYNELLLRIK